MYIKNRITVYKEFEIEIPMSRQREVGGFGRCGSLIYLCTHPERLRR